MSARIRSLDDSGSTHRLSDPASQASSIPVVQSRHRHKKNPVSQVLINQYLADLSRLKRVSGEAREGIVSEAFKDLLKGWGRQHDLIFIPQYRLDSLTKDKRWVDGALVHELRVPFGYWEAKDDADDLDEEIARKFKRGYPQDNIIFEDSTEAVLIQRREEVMRCQVTDVKALEKLLKLFFGFERAEIADFRQAVEQFKTDLPAVLEALRSMIETAHETNAAFAKASTRFLEHAQEAINPSLTDADVREMLIQHVLTEEIFSKVFDSEFHRDNNVARELYKLEETFFTGGLKKSTLKGLEPYYAAIRGAAAQIGSHHEDRYACFSFFKHIALRGGCRSERQRREWPRSRAPSPSACSSRPPVRMCPRACRFAGHVVVAVELAVEDLGEDLFSQNVLDQHFAHVGIVSEGLMASWACSRNFSDAFANAASSRGRSRSSSAALRERRVGRS